MRIETNTCTYKQDLTGNKQLATQVASRAETERNSAHNDVTVKDILGLHRFSHHYTGFTGGLRTWNPAPVLLVGQSAASKLLQRERPQQSTTVGNQPFTQRFIIHQATMQEFSRFIGSLTPQHMSLPLRLSALETGLPLNHCLPVPIQHM
jgi:hypothetical protein